MVKKYLLLAVSLGLLLPNLNNKNLVSKSASADEVNEHLLTLTSGTLKMGGSYGTTSAYYKIKGAWDAHYGNTNELYMDSGFIVNSVSCSSPINMSYYAINEGYDDYTIINPNSGCVYGAIRVDSCTADRIGSGANEGGFLECTYRYSPSEQKYKGKMFSQSSNPALLRYDEEQGKRTLPSDVTDLNRGVYKGGAKNYTSAATAYANYKTNYFGIGWYCGVYHCDLTNVCFYDDDYNSLGCTVDCDADDATPTLYGQVGKRIYVSYDDTVKGFKGVNGTTSVTIEGFKDEGEGVYSFIMPDSDVTISPIYKGLTFNINIGEHSEQIDIQLNKDELENALTTIKEEYMDEEETFIGYSFNNNLFQNAEKLISYLKIYPASTTYDVTIETVTLKMNKEATFRTTIGSQGLRLTGSYKGNSDDYGMIVTKYKNITGSLDDFKIGYLKENQYRTISSKQEGFKYIDKNGTKEFSSVIVNMQENSLVEEYVARTYVNITYYGSIKETLYSAISDEDLFIPYEAGLIASQDLADKILKEDEYKTLYEYRQAYMHQYYDSVCNIDSSYHLIGNGRNYTVEKAGAGKIKITPLNDLFSVSDIKHFMINGVEVNYSLSNNYLLFNKSYVEPIALKTLYNDTEMDIFSSGIRGYLSCQNEDEQAAYLLKYSGSSFDRQTGSISFSKMNGVDYHLVYISEDESFLDNYCFKISSTGSSNFTPGCLIPGRHYYYKVVAIVNGHVFNQSDVDSFYTSSSYTLRQINVDNVRNVRDEGGYITEDGKTVKYSLLYRGACLNGHNNQGLNSSGNYMVNNVLKWQSEIDFRTTNADDTNTNGEAQYVNAFDETKPYVKATLTQACYIFPNFKQTTPLVRSYDSRTKTALQAIFTLMADESNYPVYFHCNAGADRTGTFGYLILGLLGVSYEDLCIDFELTSFSVMGKRWRSNIVDGKFDDTGVMEDDSGNYVAFGKMHNMMMEEYGTGDEKISSAIENYLINAMGVTKAQIDSVKSILLED